MKPKTTYLGPSCNSDTLDESVNLSGHQVFTVQHKEFGLDDSDTVQL